MTIKIVCGKCDTVLSSTRTLKSIKEAAGLVDTKCPSCGHRVAAADFNLEATEKSGTDRAV